MMQWTVESRKELERWAAECGFDLSGVAAVPDSDTDEAAQARERFAQWVAAGRAGDMDWLKRRDDRGQLLRGDLRVAMPWARSVIVCAANYNTEAPRSIDEAGNETGWVARYAWSGLPAVGEDRAPGADYHDTLLVRLKALEARVQAGFEGCATRCYVDTGPIVERGFAQLAGIGWVGKNTCVLNQQIGSWLLLGVLVTSIPVAADAVTLPAVDRCGSCTRCIQACPTDALIAPRQMDASRCISYLTIEKKGSIPNDLREGMGRQVFGCDICQDVCPWNRRAPVAPEHSWLVRKALVNPDLEWLAALDGREFNGWFRGSPLERTGRKRVLRNVAIAMGNSGRWKFLPRLEAWASGDDPVLAEAARWAIDRIQRRASDDAALMDNPSHR